MQPTRLQWSRAATDRYCILNQNAKLSHHYPMAIGRLLALDYSPNEETSKSISGRSAKFTKIRSVLFRVPDVSVIHVSVYLLTILTDSGPTQQKSIVHKNADVMLLFKKVQMCCCRFQNWLFLFSVLKICQEPLQII